MLVLASASPRRQELLRNAAIPFTVQPADVDETPIPGEDARAYAERLAREKALKVWRVRAADEVLGADTVVTLKGDILGKPLDQRDAARMLGMLSGKTHEVITGVCLARPRTGTHHAQPAEATADLSIGVESTLVTMDTISDQDIRDYVATGEPMDKAGAYAIQGIASRWILRIQGDYSNVVGLPVALVYRMLMNADSVLKGD